MMIKTTEQIMNEYTEQKRNAGLVGGMVNGFKRKWRQDAIISFLILLEKHVQYQFTQTLAQRLAEAFSGHSINSKIIVKNFNSNRDASNKLDISTIVKKLTSVNQRVYKDYIAQSELELLKATEEYKDKVKSMFHI